MKIEQEILNRIRLINWFSNLDNEILNATKFELIQITKREVKNAIKKFNWEDTVLDASNELTVFLDSKHRDLYQNWNNIAKNAKIFIENEITPKIALFKDSDINDLIINHIKWDILMAIMEFAYRKCKNRPQFFLDLLEIYEIGKIPCGWKGNWPKGQLVVC